MSADTERRTVQFTLAPELAAYLAWLGPDKPFIPSDYDLFAAGYRAALADQALPGDGPTAEMIRRAVDIPRTHPRTSERTS